MNMLCADYVKYNKTDINFTCSPAVFKGDKNKIMPVDESTFNAYLDAFEAFTPHRMAATVGFYGPSIQSADILTFQEVSNVELLTSLVKDLGFEPVAQQRKGRVDEAWWPMDFACIFARPELSFKQRCTFEYINEKDWLELNGGKPIAAAYSDVLDISVLSVHLKHGQTKDLLRRLTNNGFDMLIVGDFNETYENFKPSARSGENYGKTPTMRCLEGRHPDTYEHRIDQVLATGQVSVISSDAVKTERGGFNFALAMLFSALSDHVPILANIRVGSPGDPNP